MKIWGSLMFQRYEERVIIISSKDKENTVTDAEKALQQIAALILKVIHGQLLNFAVEMIYLFSYVAARSWGLGLLHVLILFANHKDGAFWIMICFLCSLSINIFFLL